MSKPTIFLSHISEEKELAAIFKDQIEDSFLGLVDIFVSSDVKSIPLGKNWLDQVSNGLRTCKAMLLLCSPSSISRPWINFEAGAAWAREIEVAPICHSGMRPVDLPLPISLLQGLEASDPQKVEQVFHLIARQLGSSAPAIDVRSIVNKVKAFEAPYKLRLRYASDAAALKAVGKGIIITNILSHNPETTIVMNNVWERDFTMFRPYLDNLEAAGGLQYSFRVIEITAGGEDGGAYGILNLHVTKELYDAIKQI
ncbi:toll/interleukin-1 receptor domain-containing protein [Rhizobium ruizarguesonis]|uniref:toll/interleukin-1 receptor domain-containing protein n=1 Tax=Rhizobium ruizarguesonis TaxID=2081791 RepID=UPI00103107CD|nr:toll/interleukin-1 receptor domain-containing protein [Rhizobium ruizarguesonis]TAY75359.1 toll/interleukin-1 receptor domain-containing protein [Rhizobium ruizarguesonis]